VLLRGVAGAAGGVLIWVTVGLITRSTAAVRLSAVFLGAQSVTQAIVAALIPFIEPGFGANAGAIALAVAAAACILLIPAIPDTLPDFPPPASDRGSLNLPGGIALLGTFLLLGGIVGFWVFAEGLGRWTMSLRRWSPSRSRPRWWPRSAGQSSSPCWATGCRPGSASYWWRWAIC